MITGYSDAYIILIVFSFFSAFFGPVLFMAELAKPDKSKQSRIFTFSQFMLGIWAFQIALYSTGIIKHYQVICTALLPFGFYAASLQGMRFKWIFENSRGSLLTPVVTLPALIALLYILFPLLSPATDYNTDMMNFVPVCSREFSALPIYYRGLHLLFPLISLYHIILLATPLASISYIWKMENKAGSLNFVKAAYISDTLLIVTSVFLMTGFLFSRVILFTGLLFANLAYITTFVNAHRFPNFNGRLHFEVIKARYEHSKIRGIDVDLIINRLSDMMRYEKVYADEDLSLKGLAGELNISPQQLSQILNERLNKNFNRYVNEFRLEEAKKMLRDEPKRSITSIAYAVGFNSSSTFSIVFSKYEECTPREYRLKNIPE
ncbi:MAG TPA: helix-turn-helix transcriptional regulator [Spirochaetota bacterium]|nr:helix-turn-helix transcriptional regulator [Spirochaetota bacterium]